MMCIVERARGKSFDQKLENLNTSGAPSEHASKVTV